MHRQLVLCSRVTWNLCPPPPLCLPDCRFFSLLHAYGAPPPAKKKVDCFLQAELCQHQRWKDTAAADTATAGHASPAADAPPEQDGDGDGRSISAGGKGAPRLFVVREGEVFAYGGEPPFKASDMVEFTKGLAGIGSEKVAAADDEDVGGWLLVVVFFLCLDRAFVIGCTGRIRKIADAVGLLEG